MPKEDDRSEKHLRWLVKSRSNNQEQSINLYILLDQYESTLNASIELQEIAQLLTAMAFSLWRSVFLSDLESEADEQIADVKLFLGNLISNNTVAYQQDKNAREFTFRYYLSDAKYRLDQLKIKYGALIPFANPEPASLEAKDSWTATEEALKLAVEQFALLLSFMG